MCEKCLVRLRDAGAPEEHILRHEISEAIGDYMYKRFGRFGITGSELALFDEYGISDGAFAWTNTHRINISVEIVRLGTPMEADSE